MKAGKESRSVQGRTESDLTCGFHNNSKNIITVKSPNNTKRDDILAKIQCYLTLETSVHILFLLSFVEIIEQVAI